MNNFYIKIRFEGNGGVVRVRLRYDPLVDSYESLIDAILERYIPDDEHPIARRDYDVKLRDIGDAEWPIDIQNSEDLALAISSPYVQSEGCIKMAAVICKVSDPPAALLPREDVEESRQDVEVVSVSGSDANAGDKRPLANPVTPIKRPAKKKRKVASKGTHIANGAKLTLRSQIIVSVAELRALGSHNAPKKLVAMFTGYKNTASKSFANALSALKTEGMITYGKDSVSLTAAGLDTDEAKGVSPPRNDTEVHQRIKALLTPTQQNIFDLLAADVRAHPRDELANAVGYSNPASKGFANGIGKMSSLGLVHYPKDERDPKKKLVQITAMCFPFANQQSVNQEPVQVQSAPVYRAATPPLMAGIGGSSGISLILGARV